MSEKQGTEKKAKGQSQESAAAGCGCQGCKKTTHLFGFCAEHYDHFKFGLIKKTGERVSDYDKKIEHYLAWKRKQTAHKVA